MGMWDKVLSSPEEVNPSFGDYMKAFIPIVGPYLAHSGMMKKRDRAYQDWIAKNMAYNNPEELDPMGQRVQQRMLTRTGGELSTPGLMAATMMQRQAQDPENMGNFGNVAMQTATEMAGAGQTEAAATLAQLAHQNFQTPWKPTDASDKTKGPWTIVSGAQLGIQGKAAAFPYKVRYNKDGTIQDVSGLGGQGMDVNVTSSVVTPTDVSQSVMDYAGAISGAGEGVRAIDDLMGILEANPSGGISGWSGIATGLASRVMNVAEFTAQDKEVMGKYDGAIKSFVGKYFPDEMMKDRARAESMIIELAYSLARLNNMGTSGGGRGITDADMQFALKQLGSMGRVEDFKAVLEYQRNKMIGSLKMKKATTQAILKLGGKDPAALGDFDTQYEDIIKPRAASTRPPLSSFQK